tara:strand:- start:100 stop:594 length:495 start_codon:yes stop_codon:yes gene_type:complete
MPPKRRAAARKGERDVYNSDTNEGKDCVLNASQRLRKAKKRSQQLDESFIDDALMRGIKGEWTEKLGPRLSYMDGSRQWCVVVAGWFGVEGDTFKATGSLETLDGRLYEIGEVRLNPNGRPRSYCLREGGGQPAQLAIRGWPPVWFDLGVPVVPSWITGRTVGL